MTPQFVRFLLIGGIAAAANIGSRIVFSMWLPYVPAIVLAFCVGLTTGFLLNRGWVFERTGRAWLLEGGLFLLVNLIGLGQTILISWLLADIVLPGLGQRIMVLETAHAIGVIVPVMTSFLGHKYLTFRIQSNVK